MPNCNLNVRRHSWPVRGVFAISRSTLSKIEVVQVMLNSAGIIGWAECRPYARYNETPRSVIEQIETVRRQVELGISRNDLQHILPAGAARNALDCALWDLEAKTSGVPVWERIGVTKPSPRHSAYTLSLDRPEKMAEAARRAQNYELLKIKIGPDAAAVTVKAILLARPDAKLIIDANEAVSPGHINEFRRALNDPRIILIEQPLPAALDKPGLFYPLDNAAPLCADESVHIRSGLSALKEAGYSAVNVKLDKTGGLTEAINVMREAKELELSIMAGCMVGSSLAMAPMMMLESLADFIDLDGPLLLDKDISPPLRYEGALVYPPRPELWG